MHDNFLEINEVWKNNMLERRFVCLQLLFDNKFNSPEVIYKSLLANGSKSGDIFIKPFHYTWKFLYDAKDNPIIEIFIKSRKYTFNYGNATIEVLETFPKDEYVKYSFSKNIVKSEGIQNGKTIHDEFTTNIDINHYLLIK